eukprot:gene14099-biopygen2319
MLAVRRRAQSAAEREDSRRRTQGSERKTQDPERRTRVNASAAERRTQDPERRTHGPECRTQLSASHVHAVLTECRRNDSISTPLLHCAAAAVAARSSPDVSMSDVGTWNPNGDNTFFELITTSVGSDSKFQESKERATRRGARGALRASPDSQFPWMAAVVRLGSGATTLCWRRPRPTSSACFDADDVAGEFQVSPSI